MSNDAVEQPDTRPEQHGPEMDDDQVAATNELVDDLPPARPDTVGQGDGEADGGD